MITRLLVAAIGLSIAACAADRPFDCPELDHAQARCRVETSPAASAIPHGARPVRP